MGAEPHGCPDESGELASDGHGDQRLGLAFLEEPIESAVETDHGLVRESDDLRGLARAALLEAHHAGPVPVVPGRFDHQTPHVTVAR